MFRILRMFVGEKNEEFTSKLLQIKENVLPLQPQSRGIAKLRNKNNGALVQLVRIHACHAWGHGFESRTHRRSLQIILICRLFYVINCSLDIFHYRIIAEFLIVATAYVQTRRFYLFLFAYII